MAVLYPKLFLCSMRCLSCLPLTFSLQSLRFTQLQPLSSSSSSSLPSIPSLNLISDLLTKECGFSSSQVTTVMRKRPELLRKKSDHTAREVIYLLKDSGFTENKLQKTFLRSPTILTLTVDEQLKPKMEFLKNLGLAHEDVSFVISRNPRILSLSLEKSLAPRILHLRRLFGLKDYLCKALRQRPQLLTSDFKKHVIPRVEYINNLGILEGSAAFARVLSVILGLSFETLEKKTENLASLGLAEKEIRLSLQGSPIIFQCSTKKIKENMDFLMHTAGLTPEIVISRPLLLTFSVEKKLKPRYEFFECLRTNPHCKCPPNLANFLTLNEKQFLKRFGQYSSSQV